MDDDLLSLVIVIVIGLAFCGGYWLGDLSYTHSGSVNGNVRYICNSDYTSCRCYKKDDEGTFFECPIEFKK